MKYKIMVDNPINMAYISINKRFIGCVHYDNRNIKREN